MNSDKRWLTAFCPFYGCLSGVLCSWPIRLLAVQGPSLSPVGNPAFFSLFCHFFIQKQAKTSKNKQKQAKTSKNKQKQAKTSKNKQKQAKTSKNKQKQAKTSKNKQKQAKTSKYKQKQAKTMVEMELHRWYFPFFSGFSWTSLGGPKGSNGEPSTSYPLGQMWSQDYCWFKRYESSPLLGSRLKSGKLLLFLVQHEVGPRLFYGADRTGKLYLSVMLGSHRPWY